MATDIYALIDSFPKHGLELYLGLVDLAQQGHQGATRFISLCRANKYLPANSKIPIYPEDATDVCKKLEINTVESWIEKFPASPQIDPDKEKLCLYPQLKFNPENFPNIPSNTLEHDVMRLLGNVASPNLKFDRRDANYRLPDYQTFNYLNKINPARYNTYQVEQLDCEDFADAYVGFLKLQGVSFFTIGYMEASYYRDNNYYGSHAFNCVIYTTGEDVPNHLRLLMIEPQTGNTYVVGQVFTLLFANRYEVTRVRF